MNAKTISLLAAAASLLLCLSSAARAADDSGTPVLLADLPPAVQKEIHAQLAGGKPGEITRFVEGQEVTYEVEMMAQGRRRTFTVSEEGELLEMQVFMREVPRAVQNAIHGQLGKGVPEQITKSMDNGEVTYDVEATKAGKDRCYTFAADGKLLEMQVFLEEAPDAVRKAIEKEAGSGQCGDVYKTLEDDEVGYQAELVNGGKSRFVTFDPKGVIVYVEEPIALSAAPQAVQKTIKAELGKGKLRALDKTTEDGEVTFEAALTVDGRHRSLSISPDGKILPPSAD